MKLIALASVMGVSGHQGLPLLQNGLQTGKATFAGVSVQILPRSFSEVLGLSDKQSAANLVTVKRTKDDLLIVLRIPGAGRGSADGG